MAEAKAGASLEATGVIQKASGVFSTDVESENPFYSLFQRTPAKTLGNKTRPLIGLYETDSIQQAVNVLSRERILSAPVFNAKEQCVGIVDMLTILNYVTTKLAPPDYSASQLDAIRLDNVTIAQVLDAFPELHSVFCFYEENPVSMLVEVLRERHRIFLCSSSGEIVRTVSQSDVISFLVDRFDNLTPVQQSYLAKTCKDLGMGEAKVVTAKDSELLNSAIAAMSRVSAAAVVDAEGKLVGTLGAFHLSGVYSNSWQWLFKSVREYLASVAPWALSPSPARLDDTLKAVLQKLFENQVHRVWIVDAKGHPVNVITTTDVMVLLSNGEPVSQREASGEISALWRTAPERPEDAL